MPSEQEGPSTTCSSRPIESVSRRSSKPLMEKRRRARINHSLAELKSLVVDSSRKENSRYNKLEKADILEMAVKHLQVLHRQKSAVSSLNKFQAGFNECVYQVSLCVNDLTGVDNDVRLRLLGHLTTCLNNFRGKQPWSSSTLTQRSNVSGPSSSAVSPPIFQDQEGPPPTSSPLYPAVPLIASRLPSGEIAFVVPSTSVPTTPSMSCANNVPLFGNSQYLVDDLNRVTAGDSSNHGAVQVKPQSAELESVWRPW